jgi:hypothetical protein
MRFQLSQHMPDYRACARPAIAAQTTAAARIQMPALSAHRAQSGVGFASFAPDPVVVHVLDRIVADVSFGRGRAVTGAISCTAAPTLKFIRINAI